MELIRLKGNSITVNLWFWQTVPSMSWLNQSACLFHVVVSYQLQRLFCVFLQATITQIHPLFKSIIFSVIEDFKLVCFLQRPQSYFLHSVVQNIFFVFPVVTPILLLCSVFLYKGMFPLSILFVINFGPFLRVEVLPLPAAIPVLFICAQLQAYTCCICRKHHF